MFDGVKLYNEIPSEIRSSENLRDFKSYCSVFVKSKNEDGIVLLNVKFLM